MDKSNDYRVILTKWLPSLSLELELCFEEILVMCEVVDEYVQNIVSLNENIQRLDKIPCEKIMLLNQEINKVEDFITVYNPVWFKKLHIVSMNKIYKQKIDNTSVKIVRALSVMFKVYRNIIFKIVNHYSKGDEEFLITIFRIINIYARMVKLHGVIPLQSFSIKMYSNDAVSMLKPFKKITNYRILQV